MVVEVFRHYVRLQRGVGLCEQQAKLRGKERDIDSSREPLFKGSRRTMVSSGRKDGRRGSSWQAQSVRGSVPRDRGSLPILPDHTQSIINYVFFLQATCLSSEGTMDAFIVARDVAFHRLLILQRTSTPQGFAVITKTTLTQTKLAETSSRYV